MRRLALICLAFLAVPVRPPEARAEPAGMLLRVTQVAQDGHNLTVPRETRCPQAGCEMAAELALPTGALSFNTVITFVTGGAYVAFTALPPGSARIREFTQLRAAPVFLPQRGEANATVLRLAVERSAAGGRNSAAALVAGEPDALLKLELVAPQG